MTKTDGALGVEINKLLLSAGIETPMAEGAVGYTTKQLTFEAIKNCHHDVMQQLNLDLTDDSLMETPKRVAKMYTEEIFAGLDYNNFPKCTTVENKMGYDEVIVGRNISVMSVCEHHFVPFIGYANVAYIPNERVLGLSKFNRVVQFFCQRPQIQERLTEQISAALRYILNTQDVAVVITAEHLCVKLRGVKDGGSHTTTSKLCGKFRDVPELRAEFLALTT